jgi:hypothetical protein
MAVPTRVRWAFTGLLLVLSFAAGLVACGGGGGGGDDTPMGPDAMVPLDQCFSSCEAPSKCCDLQGDTFCIDVTRDMFNCGACNHVCDTTTSTACGGSECKCGQNPACTDGKTCVNALVGCRDLQTDKQNCGAPGHACGAEETCSGGVCSCGGETCGVGTTCCGGHCTDTHSDPDNCGVCHNICEGDQDACTSGTCGCAGGGTCAAPTYNNVGKCCGMGCNNVCTDKNNCGACGHVCTGTATCNLGGCSNENNPNPFLCTVFP